MLTAWSAKRLRALLAAAEPLAFLLTNSRSLPTHEAAELAAAIGRDLRESAQEGHRSWAVIVAATRRCVATIRRRSTRW